MRSSTPHIVIHARTPSYPFGLVAVPGTQEVMAAAIPNSTLHLYAEDGHAAYVEAEDFNEVVPEPAAGRQTYLSTTSDVSHITAMSRPLRSSI